MVGSHANNPEASSASTPASLSSRIPGFRSVNKNKKPFAFSAFSASLPVVFSRASRSNNRFHGTPPLARRPVNRNVSANISMRDSVFPKSVCPKCGAHFKSPRTVPMRSFKLYWNFPLSCPKCRVHLRRDVLSLEFIASRGLNLLLLLLVLFHPTSIFENPATKYAVVGFVLIMYLSIIFIMPPQYAVNKSLTRRSTGRAKKRRAS